MFTDPATDPRGCLGSQRSLFAIAAAVILVILVAAFAFGGGDDTSPDDAGEPADQTAVPDRVASGLVTVDGSDGETIETTFFAAPTATKTIIAAPSRNADVSSLTSVGESLSSDDCANVIAFDASLLSATDPEAAFLALIDALLADVFGDLDGPFGTLGGSFTGLPAWNAANDRGGDYAFVYSPSDQFPGTAPTDGPMTSVFFGEGDEPFRSQFDQWQDAGFDGTTFDAGDHGTALFDGDAAGAVLAELQQRICF